MFRLMLPQKHMTIKGALVVLSLEKYKSCVMGSRRSYHVFLRKEYFKTLELKEGEVV